jgi:hypothetical protein
MMFPTHSPAQAFRTEEEYQANLTWFRSPERGSAFARGFLHGCSPWRKLLSYIREDWELAAAKVVAKE